MKARFIPRDRLVQDFNTVAAALNAAPMESIAAAALRVFRQNCAKQVQLDVARIVLEMNGQPADKQWELMQRAARIARGADSKAN